MIHAHEAAVMSHAPLSTNTAKLFKLCELSIEEAIRSCNCVMGVNGLLTNKAAHVDVASWRDTAVMSVMESMVDKYNYKCVVRAVGASPSVLVVSWEHINMKEG